MRNIMTWAGPLQDTWSWVVSIGQDSMIVRKEHKFMDAWEIFQIVPFVTLNGGEK